MATRKKARSGPKRDVRVCSRLSKAEARKLKRVQNYVGSTSGYYSEAEAIRFLIRDWESP